MNAAKTSKFHQITLLLLMPGVKCMCVCLLLWAVCSPDAAHTRPDKGLPRCLTYVGGKSYSFASRLPQCPLDCEGMVRVLSPVSKSGAERNPEQSKQPSIKRTASKPHPRSHRGERLLRTKYARHPQVPSTGSVVHSTPPL
uniref:Putative secreted protein n=1 Tax=Anopheles darlingi TaxID=43151 RepID=A0A2M4D817_ANODA